MTNTFVIDDTGSPGNPLESLFLKSDRKTYVAVFVHSDIEEVVIDELNNYYLNIVPHKIL
jgi:hypothetical protein